MNRKSKILLTLTTSLLFSSCFISSCTPSNVVNERQRENVTNFDLGNGHKYSGTMYKGLMDGEGTIKFKNFDTLKGTFIDGKLDETVECVYTSRENVTTFTGLGRLNEDYSFSYLEGKLELSNKRSYTGKFKDNLYHDEEAIFDFGTNTKYVGPFENGSNVGLIGTIYYPPSQLNGEGVWYFKGKMASLGKFEMNQLGEGKIKFNDWSIYTGGIYINNSGFWRKGFGVQDFSKCGYNASVVGGPSSLYLEKYVGNFDYEITQWIYGNGTMYYTDLNNKPSGYMRGFFNALKRSGNPTENIEILEEYKNTKEYSYDPENLRSKQYQDKYNNRTCEILFAGDSYMDMWQANYGLANYEEDTKDIDCINTGIGGTVGSEWVILHEKLIKPFAPNKVFIHLGFNDTHFGFTKEQIVDSFKKISESLIKVNPNIKIHFLGIEPSPAFVSYFEIEQVNNEAIKNMCEDNPNLIFIDTQNLFISDNKPISNLATYFSSDYVHLNSKGYEMWFNKIKEYL